jgi:hypothetical protein
MKIFVWATNNYMNMHEIIKNIWNHRYLQTIILVSEFLKFDTMTYCITINLVQPNA